jgi:hypothetical protein
MLIKFDDERKGIFAEWREGEKFREYHLLTYPQRPAPPTARTVPAETLQPEHFYQVGYHWPYDAGNVGGDIQAGTAWKRRWASWHVGADGPRWRVVEVTAYIVEDDNGRNVAVAWDFVVAASLHGVYDYADEDGYVEGWDGDLNLVTDEQVRDFVRNMPDATVTERALDWFEEHS